MLAMFDGILGTFCKGIFLGVEFFWGVGGHCGWGFIGELGLGLGGVW